MSRSATGVTKPAPSANADADETATLWIVPAAPGNTPVRLDNANAPGVADQDQTSLTNSFPKWSPFVFRRDKEQGERLEWLTFSSRRNYGLRSPSGGDMLIWMVAVEPDKALAGQDPSAAAFAIPYQDLDTSEPYCAVDREKSSSCSRLASADGRANRREPVEK